MLSKYNHFQCKNLDVVTLFSQFFFEYMADTLCSFVQTVFGTRLVIYVQMLSYLVRIWQWTKHNYPTVIGHIYLAIFFTLDSYASSKSHYKSFPFPPIKPLSQHSSRRESGVMETRFGDKEERNFRSSELANVSRLMSEIPRVWDDWSIVPAGAPCNPLNFKIY